MVTTTKREEAELELQGARARLAKVLHELEVYGGRKDQNDHEYHWLLVEYDEAMRARQALEAL